MCACQPPLDRPLEGGELNEHPLLSRPPARQRPLDRQLERVSRRRNLGRAEARPRAGEVVDFPVKRLEVRAGCCPCQKAVAPIGDLPQPARKPAGELRVQDRELLGDVC